MKQADDTQTMDLTLPATDGIDPADQRDIDRMLAAWRVVLNDAITADPAGKKGVAERLGVSRPYVSRVTTGNLQHRVPAKFIARVSAVLMRVDCPYLQRPLAPADCRSYAERNYAQISSFEVDHWRACRGCPNNARPQTTKPLAAQDRKATTTTATATANPTPQGAPA